MSVVAAVLIQALLADDADPIWLAGMVDTEEAAKLVGISPNAMARRVANGWTRFAMSGKKYVFARQWLRDAMLREADEHCAKRGIKTPRVTQAKDDDAAWLETAKVHQALMAGASGEG